MTKKIGLACALIHAPRLVILDEPFESVDPVSGEHIRAILRGYVASGGTVVLSSHVMELVESLCDELAVVAQGRVLAAGTARRGPRRRESAAPLPGAGGLHRGRGGGPGVVAILVRLKLSLLRNTLRRSVWRTVGLIIGIVYALGVVVMALVGLVALRWSSVALTADVTVLAFATLTAGLAAAVAAGVRYRRDPRPVPVRPVAGAGPRDHARAVGLRSDQQHRRRHRAGRAGAARQLVAGRGSVCWPPWWPSRSAWPPASCSPGRGRRPSPRCSAPGGSGTSPSSGSPGWVWCSGSAAIWWAVCWARESTAFRTLLSDAATAGRLDAVRLGLGGAGGRRLGSVARSPVLRLLLAVAFVVLLWLVWGHYLGKRLTEPLEAARGAGRMRGGDWSIGSTRPPRSAGSPRGRCATGVATPVTWPGSRAS